MTNYKTKRIHPHLEYPRTVSINKRFIGVLDRPRPRSFEAYAYAPDLHFCKGAKLRTGSKRECLVEMHIASVQ